MQIKTLSALFKALEEADVRYMVAGGLAVVAHGYLRFTADIEKLNALRERKNG